MARVFTVVRRVTGYLLIAVATVIMFTAAGGGVLVLTLAGVLFHAGFTLKKEP